jgi:hypothetical protein
MLVLRQPALTMRCELCGMPITKLPVTAIWIHIDVDGRPMGPIIDHEAVPGISEDAVPYDRHLTLVRQAEGRVVRILHQRLKDYEDELGSARSKDIVLACRVLVTTPLPAEGGDNE